MRCGIAKSTGNLVAAAALIYLSDAGLSTAAAGDTSASALHISYVAGATSDYVYRGVSQTSDRPALFIGANLAIDDVYAGIWTSNVDFTPFGDRSSSEEIDLLLGLTRDVMQTQLDLGVVFVEYVNSPGHTNYLEAHAKVSRDFGQATIATTLAVSPAYPGQAGWSVYNEASAKYTFSQTWSVSLALGSQVIERGPNYVTWNFGPTYAVTPNVSLDLRYSNTDHHNIAKVYGERVTAMLTVTL